jgi:hypothetical protein
MLVTIASTTGFVGSCGSGTAGLVANGGGGDGNTNAPAAISGFTLDNPKVSPTVVRFVLSDAEADTSTVELRYQIGSAPAKRLTHIIGGGANPAVLPSAPQGVGYEVEWDYAAEDDFPDNASYIPGVRVFGNVAGGIQEIQVGANAAATGLGNDPPVVIGAVVPSVEVDGIVGVSFELSDSSDDIVDVRVEYDIVGDAPDAGWRLARPALLGVTPLLAFESVIARNTGSDFEFFWDTDVDLGDLEKDVRLRLTAIDPEVEGASLTTAALHVDNNAAPIAQFDSGLLVLNPDERRGIPIPFRVIDEEGDLVEMIFQWRREGESFPTIPSDDTALDGILTDSTQRRAHHICTPYLRHADGRLVPVDANRVRLPELASRENWILARGVEGSTLELLRPPSVFASATSRWSTNPLVSPTAALPLGAGLSALILDEGGHLREIELATGTVVREITTLGPGSTGAMTFEHGGESSVLIALARGGSWRIARVALASGATTELVVSDGADPAPVRGIASLGAHAAAFTAGSSLYFCDYRDPIAPRLGRILDDLATPWGVAVDPLRPERLYVSERDANRVLAVELGTRDSLSLVVHSAPLQLATLESPEALALEARGSRLLVVTTDGGGARTIEGLQIGAAGGNVSFPIGERIASDVAALATGPDGLRLVCVPESNEILVAGGIEQRREITGYSAFTQEVTLESALAFTPAAGQRWRIPHEDEGFRGHPLGTPGRFVWDSADALGGSVFVRAIARDDELGPAADGGAPKAVRLALDVEPLVVDTTPPGPNPNPSGPNPRSIAASDVDGDGDVDLVTTGAHSDELSVFFQGSHGSFASAPLVLSDGSNVDGPIALVVADIDGDGYVDIVSANEFSDNLTIFFQGSDGTFATPPMALGGVSIDNVPQQLVAADLDGDGVLDLVAGGRVFFQTSARVFADEPLSVGGSVVSADLDGDCDLDLVSGGEVYFQTARGSFVAESLSDGQHVAATDIDGDGDLDVVCASGESPGLTIRFQTSPGNFWSSSLVLDAPSSAGFNFLYFVSAADLDGNGHMDLVAAANGGDKLTLFFQDSTGHFTSASLVLPPLAACAAVAIADIDGDGDLDLACPEEYGDTRVYVYLQDSPASFANAPFVVSDDWIAFASSLSVADLDSDGDLDLFAGMYFGPLVVASQDSPGRFASAPLVLVDPTGYSFCTTAADLDGNGKVDLVSGGTDGLTVFFQDFVGSFGSPVVTLRAPSPSSAWAVAAADLDRDLDLDLVCANVDIHNLTVFFQTSPGTFASSPLVLGGPSITDLPIALAAADLDGDGGVDIAAAGALGELTLYFQTSPGMFSAPSVVDVGRSRAGFFGSLAAADVDGDGDVDLMQANADGHDLTVYFQTAPGEFSSLLSVAGTASAIEPISVAGADVDSDGDIDLVCADRGGQDVTVFLQTSPGNFSARPGILGGLPNMVAPAAVCVPDLDGDGELDIVSANAGTLTIFFGGR